jgi:hypothetical protein
MFRDPPVAVDGFTTLVIAALKPAPPPDGELDVFEPLLEQAASASAPAATTVASRIARRLIVMNVSLSLRW